MKTLLLVVALAATALAQTPHSCVSPNAFSAQISEVSPTHGSLYGKYAYDFTNKRIWIREDIFETSHKTVHLEVIQLYEEKREYVIDLHTHKCTVYELNIPFIPAGIPQNATFLNTASIGDSGILGEGVNIDNWQGAIPNVGEWMGSVTSKGCLPVSSQLFSKQFGYLLASFFDVALGIVNPNVFVPPPQCFQ